MARRLVLVSLMALVLGARPASALFGWFGSSTSQPVAFNHKLHVENNGLACVECHEYVMTQTFAGLPRIEKCLECHTDPVTSSPEEEKIRKAAASGKPLLWRRLYEVPDHVYYSHRRHVVAGKLECVGCHGPIAATTKPPPRPLRALTMNFCMDCHRKRGVTNDCIACHK
ncbi:MAG: cytochrome c3 family protein [Deltaproteobacteria bacterium]|nr:cytochrome c3 family protein [Deltaproteobacteria bacterium]